MSKNKFSEDCSAPSVTVPNQTLSLKTLIERFTRGQSVATLTPVFNGSEALAQIPIERLTKQEKVDLSRELKKGITETQLQLMQREAAKRESAIIKNEVPKGNE